MTSPFGERHYRLRFEEREDSFQALAIFRNGNSWNELKIDEAPKTIIDLGANRGFSSLYWRCRFPEARLHGVEMNGDNAGRCRQLFSGNQLEGTFHEVAIADRDGLLTFRSHVAHTRHRLETLVCADGSVDDYESDTVEVRCLTLASFLREADITHVDLLKVDIEGAEQYLLETIESWAPSVKLMVLEIHHNIDQAWALGRLKAAGFVVDEGDSRNRTEWWCRR